MDRAMSIERETNEMAKAPWAHLRLPPFPEIALRVLQLANNENVQLHQLSDLISSDPAFASEVLTVANSLLFAPRFPASSILQAIAVMGANNLQGLCLTVGVRTYMGKALSQPAMRSIWRHNLACAVIAEQLASAGFMDRDIAFTCGVIHDIGRLALAVVRPKEYAELLGGYTGSAAGLLEREHGVFGKDHCEIGAQLIDEWNLPEDFGAIVATHHAAQPRGGPWGMAELINVSCRMADSAGFAAFVTCQREPFEDLLTELPGRERRLFYTDAETLTLEVAKKISAIEAL
jgi:putative nucleotidyltransferase with HDIG domain